MWRSARSLFLLALCGAALIFTSPANAECGGLQQCIAVSIDAAVTPQHGTPLVSDPITFGAQPTGSGSAARTIFVRAVTGPAGTFATLDAVTLGGTNAGEFRLSGGTCTIGTASLPQDGASCTVTVTFNPTTVGAKTASVAVQTAAITRTVPLSGTGTTPLPTATAATITAAASTPTTLDLAGFIGGTGSLSVRIASAPAHGVATLSGTRVTYTAAAGFLGADSFTYDVTDAGGTSAPALVTVTVVPRADPTADPVVIGTLRAQAQTARRFARAQIANIQARLESLHLRPQTEARSGADLAPMPPRSLGRASNAPDHTAALSTGANALALPHHGTRGATPLFSSVAGALIDATRSGSFNVAASSASTVGTTALWVGGNVQLGARDQTADSNSLRFSTDGLSAGLDRRVSERLALGMSVGYARDETDIGNEGSRTRAKGASVALYGSYQPTARTFVDGLIGYGALDFDSERYVAAANDFARGSRSGDHWFGSLAAGYEARENNVLLSPYARIDFARSRLKQYTESGAGLAALTYFEQTLPTLQFSLGVRAESIHETGFGWVLPKLRLEYGHDYSGTREARLAYADLPAGPLYAITPSADKRSSLVLGLGSDFLLRSGLRLGLDYQVQRLSGVNHSQALRFWLSKELDGKRPAPLVLPTTLSRNPVRVEAALLWDDNVNRARASGDKLADRVYSLTAGKSTTISLGTHTRLLASGFLTGDKFARYPGLDRFSLGGHAELQYRTSAAFEAPTYSVFTQLAFEEHAGQLRSGHRYSIGVAVRQPLTDRIELFAALSGNRRHAEHDAFESNDTSLRFNVDYAAHRRGVLYGGGEYRRGDAVTTVPESLGYVSIAKAFVQDDAYRAEPRYAYRLEAETVVWTLGYNLALGPRDSLDFSLRRAESKPTATLNPIYGTASKYTASQYSIAYLMRF